MNPRTRYLLKAVEDDLQEKMVFLGGPRQVGKTTLAKDLVGSQIRSRYYNWDNTAQRIEALKGIWPADVELIILDEFHKHSRWKTWLKGEYDVGRDRYKFLLTGSARLDLYRRGGDSLQGRYHYYRLHPFSIPELDSCLPTIRPGEELEFPSSWAKDAVDTLLHYGGFPEPFMRQSDRHLRRWHHERLERFFKEDVRDLTRIHDIGHLSLLAELLPDKVGSILSINSLAEDLQINFRTVANWLETFERFYLCFRLSPYQTRKVASVRKEKKMYLWDWSSLKSPGARLENLVASSLLKFCHYLYDHDGWDVELYYLRDQTGREIDFLVCQDRRPWFAVEVKSSGREISRQMLYFKDRLNIPYCYHIALDALDDRIIQGVRSMPVGKFLRGLV